MTRNKKTKVFGIVCIWQQQGVPNLVTCSSYISPENKKSSSIHRFTPHNVHTDTSCDPLQMITKAKKNIFLVIYIHIFFVGFYLVQPCAICLGQIQVFRVRQNNISVDVTNIWECCIGGMEAYPRNSKEKRSSKRILPHPYCSTPPLPPTIFFYLFFFIWKKNGPKKKIWKFLRVACISICLLLTDNIPSITKYVEKNKILRVLTLSFSVGLSTTNPVVEMSSANLESECRITPF